MMSFWNNFCCCQEHIAPSKESVLELEERRKARTVDAQKTQAQTLQPVVPQAQAESSDKKEPPAAPQPTPAEKKPTQVPVKNQDDEKKATGPRVPTKKQPDEVKVPAPPPTNWILDEKYRKDIKLEYDFGDPIGQPGSFGYARRCMKKGTEKLLAVKVIRKSAFKRKHYVTLRREVEIMATLPPHPNVIHFEAAFEDAENIYLVMELCEGGELFDRITKKGQYSERDAAVLCRQMLSSIAHLHESEIAHCDIKPDNFLFLTKDDDSVIKLIDFGMSRRQEFAEYHTDAVGTPYYVAPEVLDNHYTKGADIWSLGVVFFIMIFGYPPFHPDPSNAQESQDDQILSAVLKGFTPKVMEGFGPWFPAEIPVSDAFRDFLTRMLTKDTASRATADELQSHPWISGVDEPQQPRAVPLSPLVLKSLRGFSSQSKFKQAVLQVLADHMDETTMRMTHEDFKRMDTNHDGLINVFELQKALFLGQKQPNSEKGEVWRVLKNVDLDKDLAISYQELLIAAANRRVASKVERMREAFASFDKNGDGKISKDELRSALATAGIILKGGQVDDLVAEADQNKDGFIEFEEFLTAFGKKEATVEDMRKRDATAHIEIKKANPVQPPED